MIKKITLTPKEAQSLRALVKKLRKKLPPNIIENVVGYGYKISF